MRGLGAELMRAFLDAAPDAIVVADAAGSVVFANEHEHEGRSAVGVNLKVWQRVPSSQV